MVPLAHSDACPVTCSDPIHTSRAAADDARWTAQQRAALQAKLRAIGFTVYRSRDLWFVGFGGECVRFNYKTEEAAWQGALDYCVANPKATMDAKVQGLDQTLLLRPEAEAGWLVECQGFQARAESPSAAVHALWMKVR